MSNYQLDEAEYAECIQALTQMWSGNGIYGFSITEAAYDLYTLIDLFNKNNRRTLVYGVSYGTLVVSRYMQVSHTLQRGADPQAVATILDGVVAQSTIKGLGPRTVFDKFVRKFLSCVSLCDLSSLIFFSYILPRFEIAG